MTVTLNPFQLQLCEAVLSGAPVIGIRAGWGSGKTFGIIQAIILTAARYLAQVGRPVRILLVTDTDGRYRRNLHPEAEKFLPPLGWKYKGGAGQHWKGPSGEKVWIRAYFRQSTRSIDQNSLEGLDVDVAFVDEAQTMDEEMYTRVWGRIRSGKPPQVLISGVPTWFDWWIRKARETEGGRVIFATSYVNHTISQTWFNAMKASGEYEEKVLNLPKAPKGSVYAEWVPTQWPDGNLAPTGWTYNPEWVGRLTMDFGYRHPSGLLIVEDPDLGVDVVVREWNPERVLTKKFGSAILEEAAPRRFRQRGLLQIDAACGDVAGGQTQSATGTSDIAEMERLLGIPIVVPPGDRRRIPEGVKQTRARIQNSSGKRRLLCTREVWESGLRVKGVSFAKALASYKYPSRGDREEPVKDGMEHPLDALRYYVAVWRWWTKPLIGSTPGWGAQGSRPAWYGLATGDR